MDHTDKLDDILNTRAVPEMRSNLAHRIIERAARETQAQNRESFDLKGLIQTLFDQFLIPQPIALMIAMMVIGAYIGMYPVNSIFPPDDTELLGDQVVAEYFLVAEDLDYGEVL